jgi:hypothetical protein
VGPDKVRDEPGAKVDPELLRQLDAAGVAGSPVEAVIGLRPRGQDAAVLTPEQTERLSRQLLERVERSTGVGARAVNVFQHLGSFLVVAEPAFLVELLAQPEIRSAVANRQPDDPPPG